METDPLWSSHLNFTLLGYSWFLALGLCWQTPKMHF